MYRTVTHERRALAIDCRPIQPLQTPRSFREKVFAPQQGLRGLTGIPQVVHR